jgi:DNA repair protein RadC
MNRIAHVTIKVVKEGSALYDSNQITAPEVAVNILKEYLEGADREHFVVMCLDTKNKVNAIHTVSIGTLDTGLVHPREVFKLPIIHNAGCIIVGHNHPSGDPTPSPEDIRTTKRLQEVGELMGIKLLDHIIIGDNKFASLQQKGLM